MTTDERLSAIEDRLDSIEKWIRRLDDRTLDQQRIGPAPRTQESIDAALAHGQSLANHVSEEIKRIRDKKQRT